MRWPVRQNQPDKADTQEIAHWNNHLSTTPAATRIFSISAVGAPNNADLARILRINQSTISSWKARGRVPKKFFKLIDNNEPRPQLPPEVGGQLQDLGTTIALLRYVIIRNGLSGKTPLDESLSTFMELKPFWLIMNRAMHEIKEKKNSMDVDLKTAHALIAQKDLRDPAAAYFRTKNDLQEDILDTPWLDDWKGIGDPER